MFKNNKGLTFLAFIFTFVFMFSAPEVHAADSVESTVEEIFNKTPVTQGNDVDYMSKWLKEIFGDFIFAPWGANSSDSTTLVAEAVGFTNILALILGVVIVYYVFIGGSINAAGKGEVMGQNWSGTWMPLRTMIGFALIMPIGSLGGGAISLVQVFIIWLIIVGSNAANLLWSKMADKLATGSRITEAEYVVSRSQVAEIAKMMNCADSMLKLNEGNGDYFQYTYTVNGVEKLGKVSGGSDGVNHGYTFTSLLSHDSGTSYKNQLLRISFGIDGACGNYEFPKYLEKDRVIGSNSFLSFVPNNHYKIDAINAGHKAAKTTLLTTMSMVDNIFNFDTFEANGDKYTAKNIQAAVVNIRKGGDPDYAEGNAINNILNNAFTGPMTTVYNTAASYYAENLQSNIRSALSNNDVSAKIKEQMTFGGWAAAGLWFHQIGEYSSLEYRIVNDYIEVRNSTFKDFCSGWSESFWSFFGSNECEQIKDDYVAMDTLITIMSAESIRSSGQKSISDEVAGSCSGLDISCHPEANISNRMSIDASHAVLNIIADTTASDEPIGQGKLPINSPFEMVASIGHSVNNVVAAGIGAGVLYTFLTESGASKLIALAKGAAVGAAAGGNPVSAGVGAMIMSGVVDGIYGVFKQWIVPAIMAIGSLLVAAGFSLAYVIPFMPITVWTLMIIGYLITVIEAVIASPLAVIMMVTPEGEGISGTRMERTIQLIATAVLRPSLMVIGLIASVTMGFIAFQIWNVFFFGAAETILAGGILDGLAIVAIYTMTAISITKRVISIMHSLPDTILQWFTSGVSRPFGENEVDGEMSKVGQGIDKGGQTISGIAGQAAGNAWNKGEQHKQRREITNDVIGALRGKQ